MFIYPNVMLPRLSARLFSGMSHVSTVVWLLSGMLTVLWCDSPAPSVTVASASMLKYM